MAKEAKRWEIGNDVGHFNSVWVFAKMVFVMPDLVRPHALLIYEKVGCSNMSDFCKPVMINHGCNFYLVANTAAGIHFHGVVVLNFQS